MVTRIIATQAAKRVRKTVGPAVKRARAGAGEAAIEVRSATVAGPQHGERLDKVLVAMAPEFSRSHLQHLLALGHVQVDGVVATLPARRMRAGQQLRLELVPKARKGGFLSPHVSKEFGGLGLDHVGKAIVFEEAGYSPIMAVITTRQPFRAATMASNWR